MTRYLETLIAQARGVEPQVKPRLRSRFEPDTSQILDAMSEEIAATPSLDSSALPLFERNPDIPVVEVEKPLPAETRRPAAEPGREIYHHIQEHSERIERIEHRTVAQAIAPAIHKPEPERVVVGERMVVRAAASEPPPKNYATTKAESPPYPDSKPVRVNQETPVTEPESPMRTVGISQASTSPLPPFAVAAEVTTTRREPVETSAMSASPQITISIGVLDIRMTQEAAPDRRPLARQQERRDSTLPLADYLAKRSGDAS